MILITGGTGFIGSNLLAALTKKNPQEQCVVCDVFGKDSKWKNVAKHAVYDFVTPKDLKQWLVDNAGKISVIFHLGAISSTVETDVDLIVEQNFKLSRFLWNYAVQHEVRYIYASSAATYGDGAAGFDDVEESEALAKLHPLNPYGWSKHVFDKFVALEKQRGAALPPQWAGLKFFNVYGPNEYHKGSQQSVIAGQFARIHADAGAKLFKSYHPEYEDGGQLRDFIWVGDVVNVMLWLAENPSVSGLFNVGTGKARSFKDLAEAIYTALGKTPHIDYIDMPESLKDKYQCFTEARMEKLRAAGYTEPMTSLEEGVRQYVQDYLIKADPYC